MSNSHKPPKPPSGIKTGYESIYTVGTYGPFNEETIVHILQAELSPRFQGSLAATESSWTYIQQNPQSRDFLKAYGAFREVARIYPLTKKNWHSGERIPITHAEEVANNATVLAFQAHYKPAYQSLREVFELVVLQAHFYKTQDKSIVGQWGRGEVRTPALKGMLSQLANDALYNSADNALDISNRLYTAYDNLGAFVHTRGVPTITMGLTGSNITTFSPEAFRGFLNLFTLTAQLCVLFLTAFFPASIVHVPAFEKFGHLAPIWLPSKDKVNLIRSILTDADLQTLESLASNNTWFQQVVKKVNALPDLSRDKIDETYNQLDGASKQGMERLVELLKETNNLLE